MADTLNTTSVRDVGGTPVYPTHFQITTAALIASFQCRLGAGILKQVTGFNDGATTVYAQVYDTVAVPGVGTIPIQSMKLVSGAGFGWSPGNWTFTNGIWVALSTTPIGFTSAGVFLWANATMWIP